MTGLVDLRPLMADRHATEMLLLARGQLNLAFRQRGLDPPDPLPPGPACDAGPERDDPLGDGVAAARARFGDAFDTWAAAMPETLAGPVLAILQRSYDALVSQPGYAPAPAYALQTARLFLARAIGAAAGP